MDASISVPDLILKQNEFRCFFSELSQEKARLTAADKLLNPTNRFTEKQLMRYGDVFRIARMIDAPLRGKAWTDLELEEWAVSNTVSLNAVREMGLNHIVQNFVLDGSERSIEEAAQLELNRSVKHLIRHDIDRSHVIFDIQDKKSDSSFFFLVLSSNKESLNKELFLDALIKRVVAAFPQATLTTEESGESGRHCVQASYAVSALFGEAIDLFQIPFYRCDSFNFVPICNSFVAENIALRFSIQKCHYVRRLYLMTLFPFNEGRGGHLTWVGEEKLRALTTLNNKQVLDSKVISIPQSFSAASREVILQLDVGVAEDEIQPHSVDRSINSIQPNLVIESFGGVDIYPPKSSICPCILL